MDTHTGQDTILKQEKLKFYLTVLQYIHVRAHVHTPNPELPSLPLTCTTLHTTAKQVTGHQRLIHIHWFYHTTIKFLCFSLCWHSGFTSKGSVLTKARQINHREHTVNTSCGSSSLTAVVHTWSLRKRLDGTMTCERVKIYHRQEVLWLVQRVCVLQMSVI